MQISKSFLVVCAAAYCVALMPLRAADADTDAKLREAMQKKLDELQTQPPAAAPAPAPTPVTAPAAQPPPAPAVSAPAPTDSENAAKAREALRRKMDDLQTQPAVAAPQSSAGRPTPPAQWTSPPTARPARQVAQPAPTPAPAPALALTPKPAPAPAVQSTGRPVLTAPPPVDSGTIAKAREALRLKMAEMETQPVPASAVPAQPVRAAQPMPAAVAPPPAAPRAPVPAPAVIAPPVVAQPVPAPPPAPAVKAAPKATLAAPPAADSDTIAKARKAMEQKMKELETQSPAEAAAIAAGAPRPAAAPMAGTPTKKSKTLKGAPVFPPMQPPPPTISADKQTRLTELLQKYKAEQLTPEEYHQQRAKILAEP